MCVAALHRPARQTMILPMEPVQHVQLTVRLPVQYAQEGAVVIAHTPGIDVASHGASRPAALAALIEAMQLWFMSCYERGELDAALKSCGFQSAPEAGDTLADMIDVQVPLATLPHAPGGSPLLTGARWSRFSRQKDSLGTASTGPTSPW